MNNLKNSMKGGNKAAASPIAKLLMILPLIPLHLAISAGVAMGATFLTPYDDRFWILKGVAFTGLSAIFGRCLIPITSAVPKSVLGSAALCTGAILASLCSVVAIAPSEQFLTWGSFVGAGSGIMMGMSACAMYAPQNKILHKVWLWGGLVAFSLMTIYDIANALSSAKKLN
jgi:FtsH-binding integral membrane protein